MTVGISASSATAKPRATTTTTSKKKSTNKSKRTATNCDFATAEQVGTSFGTTLTASVEPETEECLYQAADAATGGLNVTLSAKSPRGTAYCQALKNGYQAIPADATSVQPGQVWSAPALVKNLGGQDGFVASNLGGGFVWAARKGDTCVTIGVGGTTWLNSSAAANINQDVFGLMNIVLPKASRHSR